MNIDINFIYMIIGIFFGWLIPRIFLLLGKANLKFTIDNSQAFTCNSKDNKFLSIKIKNSKRPFLYRILFGDFNINNARAWIKYHKNLSNPELIKIQGRWATNPEPTTHAESILTERESIPIGEDTVLNIAIKTEGESEFYAFNNESYLGSSLKNKKFKLGITQVLVEVIILAEGKKYTKKFNISNPNTSLEQFKIKNN